MAKQIAEFMNVTANMQRMDSLMIATNIKNLSVSVLFYTCVAALAKITVQRKSNLPEKQYQYIKKDVFNRCIYYNRELDSTERTIIIIHDAEKLTESCDTTGALNDSNEYQLHIRLLKE